MYRVTSKNGDFGDFQTICYDKNGNIIGVAGIDDDGRYFESIENIKSIEEIKIIWPPVTDAQPAPEKRPFKVGDKVRVVSHEGFWKQWPNSLSGPDYKIGEIYTIETIFSNLVGFLGCLKRTTYSDIEHIN